MFNVEVLKGHPTPNELIQRYDPCDIDREAAAEIGNYIRKQDSKYCKDLLEISENMGLSILTRAYSSEEIRDIYLEFLGTKGAILNKEMIEKAVEEIKDNCNELLSRKTSRHQNIINQMQRDHKLEVQALKAELYDLTTAAKEDF